MITEGMYTRVKQDAVFVSNNSLQNKLLDGPKEIYNKSDNVNKCMECLPIFSRKEYLLKRQMNCVNKKTAISCVRMKSKVNFFLISEA